MRKFVFIINLLGILTVGALYLISTVEGEVAEVILVGFQVLCTVFYVKEFDTLGPRSSMFVLVYILLLAGFAVLEFITSYSAERALFIAIPLAIYFVGVSFVIHREDRNRGEDGDETLA